MTQCVKDIAVAIAVLPKTGMSVSVKCFLTGS